MAHPSYRNAIKHSSSTGVTPGRCMAVSSVCPSMPSRVGGHANIPRKSAESRCRKYRWILKRCSSCFLSSATYCEPEARSTDLREHRSGLTRRYTVSGSTKKRDLLVTVGCRAAVLSVCTDMVFGTSKLEWTDVVERQQQCGYDAAQASYIFSHPIRPSHVA